MSPELKRLVVLIRGGGELASAVAHKLSRAHFRVCMTEVSHPLAVSRGAAFCEAVYDGEKQVEGVVAKLVSSVEGIPLTWVENKLPIIIDPQATIIAVLHPDIVIDAIMAKRNLGTRLSHAPLVVGLGPGFQAGRDVHLVVETNNSENLGKVIVNGEAEKDTGIPIAIGGLTTERVLHAPTDGLFLADKQIGDLVAAGEIIASVGGQPIKAEIGGVVRALLRHEIEVRKAAKVGEIDPSGNKEVCFTIRAKMRAIAGGALEAILIHSNI